MAGARATTPAERRRLLRLSDILAGQVADEDLLAELYDLEHDEITEDLVFFREWANRHRGTVADIGCGSGRLFGALLAGGAHRILGVDGSEALLRRAAQRIASDDSLRLARDAGRIELARADARTLVRRDRFDLVIMAGLVAHLDGPEDATRALQRAAELLAPAGELVVDVLGPGALPRTDLPLSVDWERNAKGRRVVRRSRIERREAPHGLRVDYATLTDLIWPDGTISRLPASFRLWYPSPSVLMALVVEAGLVVEATFGSHDLKPLTEASDRCIVVARRSSAVSGMG